MWNTSMFLLHILPNVFGLVLNSVLLVVARYFSPPEIRKYSLLIINFAICDFFACLTSLAVCQRIITSGKSIFYFSEGFCQYFGAHFCYISYSVLLHLYAHSLYSMLLSFIFRYYVLSHRTPSGSVIKLTILLIYVPSFVQMVLFCFADDPPELVGSIVRAKYPHYNLTGQTITGNLNVLEWKTLFTALHMTIPITPVYICILVLRWKIIKHLKVAAMSNKTRVMHHQLLMALTWQACLPLFYAFSVVSYVCGQLGIYSHPLLEHMVFISLGFIPVLSPIFSLYFVKQYRRCLLRFFFRIAVNKKRPIKQTDLLAGIL
ncbi:hypothetical protein KIN20_005603 [Parelaphostrongylus tenuis]|uniref:G-protein coupled receptors family 1 profile domain-containing protein n=1 Tax=Parelaphostrongylus tenuis TaxID=148309 RepID=A0AAD5MLQ9_PARTN|nr:hypothetical protein KIN20_005603 [Parelaphostrongylus tenuis]